MGERKPSIRKKWRAAVSLLLALLLVLPAGVVKGETLIQGERMEVSFDIFKQNKEDFVESSTSDHRPTCWPYWRGNDIEIDGLTPNLNWASPALDETFKDAISKMLYFDICNCWCCPGHNPHAFCLSEESDPGKIAMVPEGVAFYGKPYCFLIQFDGEPIEHPGSIHAQDIYLAKKISNSLFINRLIRNYTELRLKQGIRLTIRECLSKISKTIGETMSIFKSSN